jgi:hypothetical protein
LGGYGINKYYPTLAIMGDALLQLGTSADITTKGENRAIKYQFLTSLLSLLEYENLLGAARSSVEIFLSKELCSPLASSSLRK